MEQGAWSKGAHIRKAVQYSLHAATDGACANAVLHAAFRVEKGGAPVITYHDITSVLQGMRLALGRTICMRIVEHMHTLT